MYKKMVILGLWENMDYNEEELAICQGFIDHSLT
jgi:hypothetical protein